MKPDTTPPRNRDIAVYSLLAVSLLVGVKFAADSYLEANTRAVRTTHLENSTALEALESYRSESNASLAGGEMPIDEAMDALATRGRAAFVQIRPTADDNDGARLGWASLPATAPEPTPHATRSVFTLGADEMPPADPEVDAIESGVPAPAAPRPRPAPPAP